MESAETGVPDVWFGLNWTGFFVGAFQTMQVYGEALVWFIPSFSRFVVNFSRSGVEPLFFTFRNRKKKKLWLIKPGGAGKICSFQAKGSCANLYLQYFQAAASVKQKRCRIWTRNLLEYISYFQAEIPSPPSWLLAHFAPSSSPSPWLTPFPSSLSRGRACPWHLVQPNQALLVAYLPWSHCIEQLSICVFWLHSIEDPNSNKKKQSSNSFLEFITLKHQAYCGPIPGVSLHLSYSFLHQSCWRKQEDSLPWAALFFIFLVDMWAYSFKRELL